MWELISAVILCLFSVLGFVAFVKALIFKIYKPESENTRLIINCDNKCEDIEYTLRSWMKHIKWMGKTGPDSIIIVDNGLSKEQKEICKRLCVECGIFKIYTPKELKTIMENDYIMM